MNNIILKGNEMVLNIPKLEEYTESFIKYLDVDNKTLKAYSVGINNFLEYLKFNNITKPIREDIISFRDYLRNNYSSNTVNTYMIAIRSLFKYLEIHKKYENIAVDIKGARYDTTPKKEVLNIEQMKNIYNSLNNSKEKCLFGLMITTGLRICEISTALIEDIKYYNGEIVLFVLGKKRDSKNEYVKLSKQVLEDINNYIGKRTSGPLFVSTSNNSYGKSMSTTSLRKIIKNIFKRNNLDKDTLSCHSLRRSFAVASYEKGSSIYDIQQVLRHQNISTTTRYLKQVNRDNNKTEYNVANAIFN